MTEFQAEREMRDSFGGSQLKMLMAAALLNVFLITGFVVLSFSADAAVPCEEMLKDVIAARSATKLGTEDLKAVNNLEAKAVLRCNADDDIRSDKLLAAALKIMGK